MTKKSKSRRRRKQWRRAKVDTEAKAATKQEDPVELNLNLKRLQLNDNDDDGTDEDDLLEDAIKLAVAEKKKLDAIKAALEAKKCTHGYEPDEYIERFYQAFHAALGRCHRIDRNTNAELGSLDDARKATEPQFADVWSDSTKIAKVIQFLVAYGTEYFLEGNKRKAGFCASFANYFEQFAKINFDNTQAVLRTNKLFELSHGDDHTLVSFFKKFIPCSCLDEIYKEVKSIKKKGYCWNSRCEHSYIDTAGLESKRKLDRSSLMICSRCGIACYCSVECQKADWPRHKSDCDETVAKRNAFENEAKCYRAS